MQSSQRPDMAQLQMEQELMHDISGLLGALTGRGQQGSYPSFGLPNGWGTGFPPSFGQGNGFPQSFGSGSFPQNFGSFPQSFGVPGGGFSLPGGFGNQCGMPPNSNQGGSFAFAFVAEWNQPPQQWNQPPQPCEPHPRPHCEPHPHPHCEPHPHPHCEPPPPPPPASPQWNSGTEVKVAGDPHDYLNGQLTDNWGDTNATSKVFLDGDNEVYVTANNANTEATGARAGQNLAGIDPNAQVMEVVDGKLTNVGTAAAKGLTGGNNQGQQLQAGQTVQLANGESVQWDGSGTVTMTQA